MAISAELPGLAGATPSQRAKGARAAAYHGIHWAEIDEDLSIAGLLRTAS